MTNARSDQIRAFIFESGARICDPDPLYYPCMGIEAAKRSRGDIKIVECPDPDRYGEYVQVDGIPGQVGRWTSTLMARLVVGEESPFQRLNDHTCSFDLHLNRGTCEIPTDLSQFAEMEVWEDVRVTNYTTSALSSLSSDQREASTESVDVSFRTRQKIFNLAYAFQSAPIEDSAVAKSVEYVPSWCCDVGACKIAFMSTDTSLWYTFNGGITWVMDTPVAGEPAGGFRVGGRYVLVLSGTGIKVYNFSANGIVSSAVTAIAGLTDVTAVASNGRYGLFGELLNIYRINATGQVASVFDASGFVASATYISRINIDPSGFAVVGFNDGTVIYSKDGNDWLAATSITGTDEITSIKVKRSNNWLVGTTSGKLYCTDNTGLTWTKVFDNGSTDNISALAGLNDHVIYMASGAAFYRSVDGGQTWTPEPADPGRPFVTVTSIADISVCPDNINRLLLGVTTADGARVAVAVPA